MPERYTDTSERPSVELPTGSPGSGGEAEGEGEAEGGGDAERVARHLRVLIVEDQPPDAELMVLRLRDEGLLLDWRRVQTEADLRAALDWQPDVVLADWIMPGFSGLAALEIVRERDVTLPVIVVSGSIGEETAIDAIRQGADDYLLKDRLTGLGTAVQRALDTRRLRIERARAEAERAVQVTILTAVRESVIVTDPEGRVTYWNEGASSIFGYAADEMLGRDVMDLSAAGVGWSEAIERTSIGEVVDWPVRHKDGRPIWVETRTTPMGSADGVPSGFIAVSRDVTELRRERLNHERLAIAIENSAEAVVVTDADACILYVNPAYEAMTGYTAAEAVGQDPGILRSGKHPVAFYGAMWEALTAGRSHVAEFVNLRKDGSLFRVSTTISPVRDSAGSLTSYVAVMRDVTHEREMEVRAARSARERAVVADALASLPTAATPDETAQAICRRVASLAGLSAVALVHFGHGGEARTLSMVSTDGRSYPRYQLPASRARHLKERAQAGPWVERWEDWPDHPYAAVLTELGTRALGAVPIRHAGVPIGVLLGASAEPEAIDLLTDTLPALAEFADLTGMLLGPAVSDQIARDRRRSVVEHVIARQAFVPAYQPIVDLATAEVMGYEALTRLDSGDPPGPLFEAAWEIGVGPAMEEAALVAALAEAERLPAGRWLSLNVSPRIFESDVDLAAILGSATRPLVLEITEHEQVHDYRRLREAVQKLGSHIRLAVDDAGAGVANFAHIVELRPDFVKLDIGLVRNINRDVGRQALVVGMHHFARTAGCHLIAEGIEAQEEAETVTALGVEYGQGRLFGMPQRVDRWVTAEALAPVADPTLP